MTREERLLICGKCLHRKLDFENGYLCNLTGKVGTFKETCKEFVRDGTVTDALKLRVKKREEKPPLIRENEQAKENKTEKPEKSIARRGLSESSRMKLRKYQSFIYALAGGIIAALAAAIGWSFAADLFSIPAIYLSLGVGILVGLAIRYFGAGMHWLFGVLGGILTLAGCLFGSYLIHEGMVDRLSEIGLKQVLSLIRPELMINTLLDSYLPLDLVFYGLSVALGYLLSLRRIRAKKRIRLDSGDYSGAPVLYRLRLPLIIIGILIPAYFGYTQLKRTDGLWQQFYDSGQKMAEGNMKLNRESGEWTYWYENGNEKCSGFYENGLRDSVWRWYDQSGRLTGVGTYRKGVEHGTWMHYDVNGTMADSGAFMDGYREGRWKYWNADGTLSREGEMDQGEKIGLWILYYSNGQIAEETVHEGKGSELVLNVWDPSGNQIVSGGNGTYQRFSMQGDIRETGEIQDGLRTGIWTNYFSNGKINEEGIYLDGRYLVRNSWGLNGSAEVVEGNGVYTSYYEGTTKKLESGEIRNGNREGLWKSYDRETGSLREEVEYVRGIQSGVKMIYNESGVLLASGHMADGLRDGEWNWYHTNGQISATVFYTDGRIQEEQALTNTPELILTRANSEQGFSL